MHIASTLIVLLHLMALQAHAAPPIFTPLMQKFALHCDMRWLSGLHFASAFESHGALAMTRQLMFMDPVETQLSLNGTAFQLVSNSLWAHVLPLRPCRLLHCP